MEWKYFWDLYCRGLNHHKHHFEVYLRRIILWPYSEDGTTILLIIEAPTILDAPGFGRVPHRAAGGFRPLDRKGFLVHSCDFQQHGCFHKLGVPFVGVLCLSKDPLIVGYSHYNTYIHVCIRYIYIYICIFVCIFRRTNSYGSPKKPSAT